MIRLSNANHSKCPLCRSNVRLSYRCDCCDIDLLVKGYSAKISSLSCGHKLHLECASKYLTYLCDDISIQSNMVSELLKEGRDIKQTIICPKCKMISDHLLKSCH